MSVGGDHRGLVCSFLGFRLQIVNEPFALFHRNVSDHVCYVVMFYGVLELNQN